MESRAKKAVSNYGYIILKEFAIALIGIFSRALSVRKLGVSYIGVLGLFGSVISILQLSNLGAGDGLRYIMIQAMAEGDIKRQKAIFSISKKIYVAITVALIIIALFVAPFLPYIFKREEKIEHMYLIYGVFVLNAALTYSVGSYSVVYEADQRLKVINLGNALGYILTSVLQIISLTVFPNVIIYTALMFIQNIFVYIYIKVHFIKDYGVNIGKGENLSDGDKKALVSRVKDVFFTRLINSSTESCDNLLISKLIGINTVGQYNNYTIIFNNLRILSKSAYYSIEGGIGHINSISEKETIQKYYQYELFGFHCIATILCTCTLVLSQEFIAIWVGAMNILSFDFLMVMSCDLYLNTIMYALTCCINTTDLFKDVKYVAGLSAIFNIVLSIVLGIPYGLVGIIGATLISRALLMIPMYIRLVYKKLFLLKPIEGFRLNLHYIIQFAIIAGIVYFISGNFPASNVIVWSLKGIVIFVAASLLLVIFNFRNENMSYFLKLIKSVALKRKN